MHFQDGIAILFLLKKEALKSGVIKLYKVFLITKWEDYMSDIKKVFNNSSEYSN